MRARQVGAEIQERALRLAASRRGGSNKFDADRNRDRGRNRARTSSFMGVKRDGLAAPSSDSKYSSARLTPSQSKRPIRSRTPARDGPEAIAVGQVHELAPVELGILQHGGLLAPFRMIVPELLADVRQLQPGIDQDALAMAGSDQLA